MTEERIKAICKKIARVHSDYNHTEETTAACVDAITWYRKAVWHDGSETPKFGCPIFGITIFGEAIIDGPFGIEYDVNIDMSNIKKWAYIKDLMPKE